METRNWQVIYAYPEELPSQRARTIQVVQTCKALAACTKKLYLCVSQCDLTAEKIWEFYGLEKIENLEIVVFSRKFLCFRSSLFFNWELKRQLQFLKPDAIITRHLQVVSKIGSSGIPIIFECHQFMAEKSDVSHRVIALERKALLKADGIAFLTAHLQRTILDRFAISDHNSVIPSGTFVNSQIANKKLGTTAHDVLYVGSSRYSWKGIKELLEAIELIPSATLHWIGAMEGEWSKENPLVKSLITKGQLKSYGYLSPQKVKEILPRFEIAVLPNTDDDANSRFYTSPLKLLEYMAFKVSVVASDLPSIREIVSEDEVLFVKPQDSQDLARGITRLINEPSLRIRLAENAWNKVQAFSWESRAAKFLDLLSKVISLTE